MKNAIFAYLENRILAVCESEEMAHSVAETLSYTRVSPTKKDGTRGNALYCLHGIKLIELESEEFYQAGNSHNFIA